LGHCGAFFQPAEFKEVDRHLIAIDQAMAHLKLLEPESDDAIQLSEDDDIVTPLLVGDLLIAYVVDVGAAFRFVQGRHLKAAAIGLERLHEIGIANLSAKLADERLTIQQMGDIYVLFLDQNLEASLMLCDRLWDEMMIEHLPGDVVAAVPAREHLMFCDASSAAGIDTLKTLIERVDKTNHPLSRLLFRRDHVTKTWHVLEH
jgi:uncharacterized protein YtpQ (UPF0354 family)